MNVKKKKISTFDMILYAGLGLLCIVTIYPVIYVFFSSISDPLRLTAQEGIMLYPAGFSLEAYRMVLKNPSILVGYRNTIIYVVLGLIFNMSMTILGAFCISRMDFLFRKAITIFIIITMQFSGGLIPTYVVVESILGNTIWTQIIPGAIATANLLIMRTAFMAIPASLEESVKIDGGTEWTILSKIILPLSKPTLAVISLYYGVAHWNQWLQATIYLRDRNLYPLQVFLREILLLSQLEETMVGEAAALTASMDDVVKYATIIVSILPVLIIYPFIQKFFVKGVMLGAIKG